MSHFYDPWQHAMYLFMTRVMQFLFLSLVLGLVVWACLLHSYFDCTWLDTARATWAMLQTTESTWRAIFGLCFVVGALLSAWLFTWLMLRARLQRGDSYRRGSRVVQQD